MKITTFLFWFLASSISTIHGIQGQCVTTFVGSGNLGSADGVGLNASFNTTLGISTDLQGNLYVADFRNHRIRKIDPTGIVSTFAGSGSRGSVDGVGINASFSNPQSVATDAAGNLYVADTENYLIRKITPEGMVTTLAGMAGVPGGSTDGMGADARFNNPVTVETDAQGNVYVADAGNHIIRKVTPEGMVTTIAGMAGVPGSADGMGSDARFNAPVGLAIDPVGNIYVADNGNCIIRKITPGGMVTTIAGMVGVCGSADGTGVDARFTFPVGMDIDIEGNLYVAGRINHTVRKITPDGVVTTIAGMVGVSGSADGMGTDAKFSTPYDIAIDPTNGNIYVGDTGNNVIRKIDGCEVLISKPVPIMRRWEIMIVSLIIIGISGYYLLR